MKSINLPSKKFFAILLGSIFLSADLEAGENDYIYPNQEPSFSNYGTLGLFSSPSARFLDEGSLGFAWNHMQPYLRGSLIAYPFNWLEASFQYTDINNQLYSEFASFSGNQTFKDKSFDIKLKILNERDFAPALAVGFRDFAGTGIFSSEYIVASKKVNNFDITFGLGWGMLSGNDIYNPLFKISDDFKFRKTVEGTKGGELTVDSYFSGEMGTFGGIEWFLPYLNGARLKIEYDGIDYSKEGFPPIKQASKFNAGIVYPVSKGLHLKLGIIRGNTLNFGFTFSANFSKKNSFIPKLDPHKSVENADIIKMINTDNDEFLFKSSLKFLA
ncbi:YjbH domain-containing protein, partial [Gammaproteobacteria bacterium]|nr:YjbH domain-containing protein [Gammaproteobacteria bacterium]